MTELRFTGLLLAILIACGCTAAPEQANLLLITTDTTRADHLGAYGFERATTPNLDLLAAEGVLFEQAMSHVPITLPAHTSIMTGTLPTFHGVRDNGRFVVGDELVTLAETLSAEGYETGAFVSAFVLDSRFGLDQGFDWYDDRYGEDWSEDDLRDARVFIQMVVDRPADQTTERALAWLDQVEPPFFLWVHYYDPHQRWDPPHPYNQLYLDQPYDGEIAFMDSQIGRLWNAFQSRSWDQSTLAVILGDHGEALGEHGEQTHAVAAYQSTLRIPFIVRPVPSSGIDPRRVAAPVSQADVMPTVLDLLGLGMPAGIQGRSLRQLMMGGELPARPTYFECLLPYFGYKWQPVSGVRQGDLKYIHSSRPELFDLAADPGEVFNLAGNEPGRAEELSSTLARIIEGTTREIESTGESLDPDARLKLEALGYATASSTGESIDLLGSFHLANPLDQLVVLQDYNAVRSLMGQGRDLEAASVLENAVLPLDPENPSFLTTLAVLRKKVGDLESARSAARRAQIASPEDAGILLQLSDLELRTGNLEEAEQLVRAAEALNPDDVSTRVLAAQIAARAGDAKLAEERYRIVLELEPDHLDALMGLGMQLVASGDVEEARAVFRRAITAHPLSARAHYNFGFFEYGQEDFTEAERHFERAARYGRPYPQAELGLALAKLSSGDPSGARSILESLVSGGDRDTAEKARGLLEDL